MSEATVTSGARVKARRGRYRTEPLALRVPSALKEALQRYAAQEHRSTTQAGMVLLERALREIGFYPPADAPAGAHGIDTHE